MAKRRGNPLIENVAATWGLISQLTKPVKERINASKHAAELRRKYPEHVVQRMLHERVWQGQTASELNDSLGAPHATDRKLLATKRRGIWKYYPQGVNRFRLRVTLDDRMVVGWDWKG
jgi:tRNA(Met) C34 N-acetyltransferase TmcA